MVDHKLMFGFIGGSVVIYNAYIQLRKYLQSRQLDEFVPVGTVKELYIYPIKSCKAKPVFSFYCSKMGPVAGEILDRHFMIINAKEETFITGRQHPSLLLVECSVEDGHLRVRLPSGEEAFANIQEATDRNDVRRVALHRKEQMDGIDLGDDVATLLAIYLNEPDARIIMHREGMYTERTSYTNQAWWNNNTVPERVDNAAFNDGAPYQITSTASLEELNERLENKITDLQFRPVILVDKCPAWDEDKWAEIRIGDTIIQCFRPCQRCAMTLIDPVTGTRDNDMQPLKALKQFRLSPEGPMREVFKDSPLFGVYAGIVKPGYVHVGQTVYARYKKCAF